MVKPSAESEILIQEWKEARSSIARFDEYLLNLRRYGFTLATILIGADAYLSITEELLAWAKAGAAVAVMLLILALFLLDQHVQALQDTAVHRAVELERLLGLVPKSTGEGSEDLSQQSLSKLRQEAARTVSGTPIYWFFLSITGGIGSTAVLTRPLGAPVSSGPLVAVAAVCIVLLVMTPAYNWWVNRKIQGLLTPREIERQLKGVFIRLEQTLQRKDKQI